MFKFRKLTFLASLFMVGMLVLAACTVDEPTSAPVEEAIDTQATVEAAETTAAAEAEEEMVEEPNVVTDTEPSSESQVPMSLSEVPRTSVEELKERLDNGEAIVIVDSRSAIEYDSKHIAGAISVPVVTAGSPLAELPLDQEIVFYCT